MHKMHKVKKSKCRFRMRQSRGSVRPGQMFNMLQCRGSECAGQRFRMVQSRGLQCAGHMFRMRQSTGVECAGQRLRLGQSRGSVCAGQRFGMRQSTGSVRHRLGPEWDAWGNPQEWNWFLPLIEPLRRMCTLCDPAQTQVWSESSVVENNLYFARLAVVG